METERGSVDAVGEAAVRRVAWRILPLLFTLYAFNFLDRTNIGFAALQMNRDLRFSSAVFGLGAGILFVGYAAFGVPANLLLSRFGVRRWVGCTAIAWGAVTTAMMFVRTPMQFYALRLLLGIAEAGFFPAVLYYLTLWFPARVRARTIALFMTAIPLSGAFGGPLSGALLELHGTGALAGWQWLFLAEGLPSVLLGIAALRWLDDGPEGARWLPDPQRSWLVGRLREERVRSPVDSGVPASHALRTGGIWVLGVAQMAITAIGSAYSVWAPGLFHASLGRGALDTGLFAGGIAGLSAVALLGAGWLADRWGNRALHAAGWALLAAAGCAGVGLAKDPALRLVALAVVQVGATGFLAPFMSLPALLLGGVSLAVGIALANSLAHTAGFFGPVLLGVLRDRPGGVETAFLVFAAMAAAAAGICIGLHYHSPLLRGRAEPREKKGPHTESTESTEFSRAVSAPGRPIPLG